MKLIDRLEGLGEVTLDVVPGAGGFLEISVPDQGFYYYTDWGELPQERQEFFRVVVAAQSRILNTFIDEAMLQNEWKEAVPK